MRPAIQRWQKCASIDLSVTHKSFTLIDNRSLLTLRLIHIDTKEHLCFHFHRRSFHNFLGTHFFFNFNAELILPTAISRFFVYM